MCLKVSLCFKHNGNFIIFIFIKDWGSHEDFEGPSYLTAAAALGLSEAEIEVFFKKLRECWKDLQKQKDKNKSDK